jgi:3-deoxy-D-manno-octulosonate 8-phosphate phosphatase (KDO 8-P phosphatase)
MVNTLPNTRLVLTDVDGVLTDAGVYYSARGEELKRFSLRDGMGVERLRDAGIATAFVTREQSEIVRRRAEKLDVRVYSGVRDKASHLDVILRDTGCELSELAYIGDDVNDLEIIERIRPRGLIGAPRDAMPEILALAHFRCPEPGGHGAFRAFAEWILSHRGSGTPRRNA